MSPIFAAGIQINVRCTFPLTSSLDAVDMAQLFPAPKRMICSSTLGGCHTSPMFCEGSRTTVLGHAARLMKNGIPPFCVARR